MYSGLTKTSTALPRLSRRCLALAQRERFSKVQVCTVCGLAALSRFLLILYTMVLIFVNTIKMPSETVSVPCPDFC
ncbi:Uncharacterised protein [Neisseria meningitidis]|nr:Uncharacterised protein [Neisseria meningitidis]